MARDSLRTNFNSSSLIRLLADLAIVNTAESRQDFAERLGEWLDVADAITLFSAHGGAASSGARSSAQAAAVLAVQEEFARVRMGLAKSITESCSPDRGGNRLKLPAPQAGTSIEIAADYLPYHRFHLAHQRDMETRIGPLRARVREALARASPTLQQLASLDAALDRILFDREYKSLATVPWLLEKRFEQLLKAHRQTLADTGQADDTGSWMQAGGWLAGFCRELQGVLLAELDLRLQPVTGLIEAFSNEVNQHK